MPYQPNSFLRQAIQNHHLGNIRSALVGIIQSDPLYETKDLDAAINYLHDDEGIDIVEDRISDPQLPINQNRSEWTSDYFATALVYLRNDFTKERLEHVKEVSIATHEDMKAPPKLGNTQNKQSTQEQKLRVNHDSGNAPHPTRGRQVAMLVTGAVILLAAVVLVIKILKRF